MRPRKLAELLSERGQAFRHERDNVPLPFQIWQSLRDQQQSRKKTVLPL